MVVFLHFQGEAHKVFWPEQSEFVRMAARFGCTIIPLATVGEDDLIDVCFPSYLLFEGSHSLLQNLF